MVAHIFCLLACIPLKSSARFGQFLVAAYVGKAYYGELRAGYGPNLLQFVRVICGKDYFPHRSINGINAFLLPSGFWGK